MEEEVFCKRGGTTDLGKDYEDIIIADLILKLINNKDLINFKLSSNNLDYGDFDDIVLELQYTDQFKTIALQLKHTMSEKRVLQMDRLTKEKGDFSIKKYLKSFENMKDDKCETLILFTTMTPTFDCSKNIKVENDDLFIGISKLDSANSLINTSQDKESCYKLTAVGGTESSKYEKFFKVFFLYTKQQNVATVKRRVKTHFQELFLGTEADCDRYLQFISEWSKRDGKKAKLDKFTMERVIALTLLTPFIEPLTFNEDVDEKKIVMRKAISCFDVTFVRKEMNEVVSKLWADEKSGLENSDKAKKIWKKFQLTNYEKTFDNLDGNTWSKLLWLMGKSPILVRESCATNSAIKLFPNLKYVILSTNAMTKQFSNISVFTSLSHLRKHPLVYQEVISRLNCSLQGKRQINLKELFDISGKCESLVTTTSLLKMLNNCYRIGEEKELISEAYIKRFLSENTIDIKYFQNVDKNAVYVLNCMNKFDKIKDRFSNFNQIRVSKFLREEEIKKSVNNYEKEHESDPYHRTLFHTSPNLENFVSGADIYKSSDKCSVDNFEQICEKNPEAEKCHHFRVIDEKHLEWIRSKGDISDMEEFRVQTTFIEESNLYKSEPETNINLIIGDPGMGKSELLKNMKNYSLPKVWAIFLDSKDITLLCEHLESTERQEYFNEFVRFILDIKYNGYAEFDKTIIKVFLEDYKAAYFWDALDEVPTKDIETVINLIEDLSLKSSYQWVTSRCHLKKQLEMKFGVLSRSIRQLDEMEQSLYIRKRLEGLYNDKDIEEVMEKIKSTVTLVKHNNILGTPLQIFMLTELFRQDGDKYFKKLQEMFSLTELYHHIIQEKFNLFYQNKAHVHNPNDALKKVLEDHKRSMFEKYEKAALKALVTKEVLKRFNINCDDFLKEIQGRDDSIGLITEVTDSFPQFLHNSYAEYFVATFFVEHHKEIPHFEDIIYDKRYANIRFFFDLLSAKDSAAHVGVLYRNFDLIKQCKDALNSEDKKGRSALQLACSWGQNYQILKVSSDDGLCVVDNENDDSNVGETPEYVEMLHYLLANSNISNYANLSSRCLMAKIEIMSMVLKQNNSIKLKTDTESISIFYYAAKFGYTEVLDMFESVPFIKAKKDSSSLLHVAVTYKQEQFLQKLLCLDIYKENIDDKDKYGRTSLYKACQKGYFTLVEILIKEGANVDIPTYVGCTPLHVASLYSYDKIVELLLRSSLNKNPVKNFGITPLHVASWNGNSSTVDLLIKHGVQVDVQADDGCTPLYVSSRNKHDKVVKSLVDNGALVDLAQQDDVTPLFIASQEGHEQNVELLLKAGANVNLVTKSGESPLYIACQNGHNNIVKMLIEYNVDVDTTAANGWTPLKIACQQGHLNIIEMLTQAGAKSDESNLMIARSHGHEDVAAFCERSNVL